ncbi:efflux RND transporter permease subunit [Maribellus maritimus]|uniref:efflux RND transporter permease subunit n=1 Tax=Maribellus maritimus TaxID=2870838 RepID=UPI001EEB34F3|nr:efflux RND transporter permease subunit [Maribellus maritimus]MCG6189366.1 efflux RND transporter permease subunit [Maribellus maritimus]
MVKFLIHRPIAVTMAFLALLLIGIATTTSLPVSLMPDIDIPVVSIRVSSSEMPARQLENTVVKTLRSLLKEVNHVEEMRSETRDGAAWVELRFRHGTPIDLASVEVNEKVDKAMNSFPDDIRRPEVIRASASDIPVFYLMVNRKKELESGNTKEFLQLSNFASQVIRKRLEQLPEVALVDMSGLQYPEIKIFPNNAYLQSGAFSVAALEQALQENNIDLGRLLIRDGQYQYNIRFNTRLRDVSDISKVPVNLNGKVVRLDEIAEINMQPQRLQGDIKFKAQNAVSMAVIKQSDAKMAELKKELEFLVERFREDYPDLEFSVTRDQSKLLEYSINNLGQSLLFGGLLAFLAMFLFLREKRAPWLIGVSIPVSLIIALLFFYLAGLSINIISLSGLVLGVGMMIDNSIIVIDNITQHRQRHSLLDRACNEGTNEIIRPLISSVLTTCAVFIPLIFMKGMSGALFFDQAIAVTIGLTVSLVVSITLLPTLYRIFYKKHSDVDPKATYPVYYSWYEKGLKFVLRHQLLTLVLVIGMIGTAVVLYKALTVSRFPDVSQDEAVLKIDWNEPVTLEENNHRVTKLLAVLSESPEYVIEEAGKQQYLLNTGEEAGTSETRLYIKTTSPSRLNQLSEKLSNYLENNYPESDFSFSETDNLFNLAFGKTEAPLIVKFAHFNPGEEGYIDGLAELQEKTETAFPGRVRSKLITRNLILLETDPEKLMYYQVDNDDLYREIKSAFNVNTVFTINDNNMFVPVSIGNNYASVYDIIQNITIQNANDEKIPLSGLVKVSSGAGLKAIVAGKDGEYFPVLLNIKDKEFKEVTATFKNMVNNDDRFNVSFGGEIIADKGMLKELLVIIGVSLLLLYFILAAQFESFVLPVIVLLEVPIDLFGAFLFLMAFGAGINIMSAIGIIVMTGIIINDSILKIDTINKLMDSGFSLLRAVFEAGKRRLKPIIMTSLTTILAMLPFLFQKGMGAELQKPLALAIIGGMTIGTLVSLYFIPLMYYLLKKKKEVVRS